MTYPKAAGASDDRISELFCALDLDRSKAGIEMLGWIFADHRLAIPIAREAGITQFHFSEDLALLYLAADVCDHVDRDGLFVFAAQALRHYALWDETGANDIGCMRWNPGKLESLRGRDLISAQATRLAALKLWSIDWRWRRAQAGLRDLLATLEDRELEKISLDNTAIGRPTPAVLMMPPKPRMGAA